MKPGRWRSCIPCTGALPDATCSSTCSKNGRARRNNCAVIPRATMAERFLLDTSAFITFLQGEPGGPRVLELLEKAARREVELFACFVSLTEVQYGANQ